MMMQVEVVLLDAGFLHGNGLPLDEPMHPRPLFAAVKDPDGIPDLGIRLRAALVVAHIIGPGGGVIAFRPDFGMFQVAHQRPLAGPAPHTHATPPWHTRQGIPYIVARNDKKEIWRAPL